MFGKLGRWLFLSGNSAGEGGGNENSSLGEEDIAEELVSLAIMAPICVSDLSSAFVPKVFATDASMSKGAIVSSEALEEISKSMWLGSDKKGILCYAGLCCL